QSSKFLKYYAAKPESGLVGMRLFGRLVFLFEERQILAVAFFLQLFDRNESQGGRVDAIAHSAFVTRPIVKNVTEMRIAIVAAHFGPLHSERAIRFFGNVVFVDWLRETGPTRAAIKLNE